MHPRGSCIPAPLNFMSFAMASEWCHCIKRVGPTAMLSAEAAFFKQS
jgi:hypothetical protein